MSVPGNINKRGQQLTHSLAGTESPLVAKVNQNEEKIDEVKEAIKTDGTKIEKLELVQQNLIIIK